MGLQVHENGNANGVCDGAAKLADQSVAADEKAMDTSNGMAAAAAPHCVDYNYLLVTDGPAHLRMVLHPEASAKSIVLKPFWYRYFDLRKEFRKSAKLANDVPLSIARMLERK